VARAESDAFDPTKLPTHTHDELFAELQSGGGALAAAAAMFDAADD
jgi:hypothetical protein